MEENNYPRAEILLGILERKGWERLNGDKAPEYCYSLLTGNIIEPWKRVSFRPFLEVSKYVIQEMVEILEDKISKDEYPPLIQITNGERISHDLGERCECKPISNEDFNSFGEILESKLHVLA